MGNIDITGTPSPKPSVLRERDLAEHWQVSLRTLQRWRAEGMGPAYILIGGTIRYRMADVLDYEARRTIGGRGRK